VYSVPESANIGKVHIGSVPYELVQALQVPVLCCQVHSSMSTQPAAFVHCYAWFHTHQQLNGR
jgi:hypothetical protein